MILKDLQQYLAEIEMVSLADLASHFQTDTELLRDMLQHLVRKGRVRQRILDRCDGCTQCQPETVEFYQWMASEAKIELPNCDR
jgi:putative ferrous iron transport protein C